MAVRQNRAVYQFTVTLRNIHPPIWRRIQVWEDARLTQLHRVLQIVMGWEDCHLYEFRIGGNIYAVPDLEDEREIIDVKRTRVHDVVQRVGTEVEYVYDLGDYWQHDLLLEDILQPAPDTSYPRCIAGERNCPPEDVGGSGGYEDYLEGLADPKHEQHEDMDAVAWADRGGSADGRHNLWRIPTGTKPESLRLRSRMIRPICWSRKPTDIEVNLRGRPPVGVVEPGGGCGGSFLRWEKGTHGDQAIGGNGQSRPPPAAGRLSVPSGFLDRPTVCRASACKECRSSNRAGAYVPI